MITIANLGKASTKLIELRAKLYVSRSMTRVVDVIARRLGIPPERLEREAVEV